MNIALGHLFRVASLAIALGAGAQAATAAAVMPSFANAPTDWSTDRYDPASFGNVGTFEGRSDVLGIGIDNSTNAANRGGLSAQFYNTQGRSHAVSGGAGSVLAADLFIDASWRDSGNGFVRTDMWGVMLNGAVVSSYPIIGFTNYGGAARLRVWDADTANGWVDLADTIMYDAWNSLSIEFTGTSFDYYVNGSFAYSYSDFTINGSMEFASVIMQAYNFNDPLLNISTNPAYTAHWSNTLGTVPEPGTIALTGAALLALAAARRRRRAS